MMSRFWGLIPILFFALKAWQYRSPGEIYQLVWFCNFSNLILGIAILLRRGNLIFICSVLLSIGLPIWVFDFIVHGDFHVFSIFTHTLSPLLGFLVARRTPWNQNVLWQTLLYYLALQALARFVTPPELNINVAFDTYAPVKKLFPGFLSYSFSNMVGLLVFTWLAHRLLRPEKAPR